MGDPGPSNAPPPGLEDDEEDNLDETAALQIESDLASSANKGRGGPPVLHGFMVLGNREVCIATQLLGLDATHNMSSHRALSVQQCRPALLAACVARLHGARQSRGLHRNEVARPRCDSYKLFRS